MSESLSEIIVARVLSDRVHIMISFRLDMGLGLECDEYSEIGNAISGVTTRDSPEEREQSLMLYILSLKQGSFTQQR